MKLLFANRQQRCSANRFGRCALLGMAFAAWMLFVMPLASAQRNATPKFRKLAPGVETTIPAVVLPEESISRHTLLPLTKNPELEWTPKLSAKTRTLKAMATDTEFHHDAWCLQFTFKPLRMLHIDIPQPNGRIQKKLVWYMVYRVKNVGSNLHPVQQADGSFATEKTAASPRQFMPQFVLESHERTRQGKRVFKAYLDRVLPSAIEPIQRREDRNRKLLSSVEMANVKILPSDDRIDRSVWGVVTWIDVDPKLDFFSIFVRGLSNSQRWEDTQGAFKLGDPIGKGRRFYAKTLQLNFWRPGDDIRQNEDEIYFGVPEKKAELYNCQEGVAYRWLYR